MVKTKQLINELSKSLRWQNFIFLLVAGCINAFGVNIFLAPVGLYDSGISGTSILLSQITPPNRAHRSRSSPASGDAKLTSTGSTSTMIHDAAEYTATANRE